MAKPCSLATSLQVVTGSDFGLSIGLFSSHGARVSLSLLSMTSTIYSVFTIDLESGESIYQCETTDEDAAAHETDRLNSWLAAAGRPCTAYYTP